MVVALPTVHFAECSLEGRLGCGSQARCPLFSVLASASSTGGFLRSFFSFVAILLSQGVHGERHEGTAFAAMRDPARDRSVCRREARKVEVPRRLWAKQRAPHRTCTRTGRYVQTSARSHVVYLFLWRMPVEQGVWDDTSRTAMHAHQKAHHTSTGWC